MLMIKHSNTTLDLCPCYFQGNHFDGVNALCGDEHFWMVNQQNTPVAGVSLRRESGASNAGISTLASVGCSSSRFLIFVFWNKNSVSSPG